MKRSFKSVMSLILVVLTLASALSIMIIPASAANYTTNYAAYTAPSEARDYVYRSGSRMVKARTTTTSMVKWAQASINYCIRYEGLNTAYLDVDGSYGKATAAGVLAFQKAAGIKQDGSFGGESIRTMKAVLSDGKATFAAQDNTGSNMVSPVSAKRTTSPFQPYYRKDITSS